MGDVQPRGPDTRTLAAFVAFVVFLGVNVVAVRVSNAELPPFWGSALRFGAAALILLALTLSRRVPLPGREALPHALAYGVLGFGLAYALLYWALVRVTAGATAVIFGTVPLSTCAIAVGLRMEKMRLTGLSGALLAVAGIVAVSASQMSAAIEPL